MANEMKEKEFKNELSVLILIDMKVFFLCFLAIF